MRFHWPEYLIEGSLLATFMVAACTAVVTFCHPESPVARAIPRPLPRRAIIGLLMGLTAIGLIYSPYGQRSGAHMNPATTLTFYTLGKVERLDAAMYIAAQLIGAIAGVGMARMIFGKDRLSHAAVRWAMTLPGPRGSRTAWTAEFIISLLLMSVVLAASNQNNTAPYTGFLAGLLVLLFITFIAPYSGMSMNPARTFGSAFHARTFSHLWIYFTAPVVGMLAAAALHLALWGPDSVYCAKLQHPRGPGCIFHCHMDDMPARH